MINRDLVDNGQRLHYGKRNTFSFLCLFLDSCWVLFNEGIGRFVIFTF